MIKHILPIALLATAWVGFSACGNNNGFKTKDGLQYKIVRDNPGKTADTGDVVELYVKVKTSTHNGKDTLLGDSRAMMGDKPLEMVVQKGQFKTDWVNGLTLLSAGDSAIFQVPMDSFIKNVPAEQRAMLPSFIRKGGKFIYEISVVSVKSQADYKKEMDEKSAQQKQVDDKILQDYFAKNNIHPQKTASGLYYVIQKEGEGPTIQKGQTVTINYTGKTLDGKVFDSNTDSTFHHVQPITITAGMEGQVIPGWTEGIMLLKKGSVATLYIPSSLAYGERGNGPIAPNSILMFDMNVTDVK